MVKSSQSDWKLVYTRQPVSHLDVEEIVAKHKKLLRDKGETEDYISQIERADRETVASFKIASEQTTYISCVYSSGIYWCKVASAFPVAVGSVPGELKTQIINYYNENLQENIVVDRSASQPQLPNKSAFWLGYLKRDQGQIMPNVGAGNISFLFTAKPSEEIESLSKFDLAQDLPQQFVLEDKDQKGGIAKRITFSKSSWKPILEEKINLRDGKPIQRIEFTQYHIYDGGIWMPMKVMKSSFNGKGAVGSTWVYELLNVKFNSSADVSNIQMPLPVGAIINDYRFAPRPGARYKIRKGGIPGDKTVLDLVEKREANDVQLKRRMQLTTARNIALPIGALLLIGGLIWWRRSR